MVEAAGRSGIDVSGSVRRTDRSVRQSTVNVNLDDWRLNVLFESSSKRLLGSSTVFNYRLIWAHTGAQV